MARELIVRLIGDSSSLDRTLKHASGSTKRFEKEVSHSLRGIASGSGVFRGLGRQVAFASGGFLAFSGAAEAIHTSIDAAREAVVAQRSLAAQMKASGESFNENRDRIEKVANSYGKFGFQNDEVIASLTVLERGTGSINKAISLQGLTADLARAKNIDLASAAQTVAKVFGGQETALRRAVPGLQKSAHGMDLIRLAQAKLAGQAAANTTATERFGAVLHDTEEIIGTALLPTLNELLNSASKYLDNLNRSGKLQENVKQTADFLTEAFKGVKAALEPVVAAFKGLGDIVGGTKNEVELLIGVFAAFKVTKLLIGLRGMAIAIGLIGTESKASAVKVGVLKGALTGLSLPTWLARFSRLAALGAGIPAAITAAAAYYGLSKQTASTPAGGLAGHPVRRQGAFNYQVQIGKHRFLSYDNGQWYDAETGAKISDADAAKLLGVSRAQLRTWEGESNTPGAAGGAAVEAAVKVAMSAGLAQAVPSGGGDDPKSKRYSATQRNTWFDRMIQRSELHAGLLPNLTAQIAAQQKILAKLKVRLANTNDITRQQNLQDQIDQKTAEISGLYTQRAANRQQAAAAATQKRNDAIQAMLDGLSFGVEKADATKSLVDNLAALRRLEAGYKKAIKIEGATLELQRSLFQVELQITATQEEQEQNRKARIAARQFRQLGLGATGEALVPLAANLRRRVGHLQTAIKGTVLDTDKTRTLLTRISKILSGQFGKVGRDVRTAIDKMLDDIAGKLKGGPHERVYRQISLRPLIDSLGLTRDQKRALQAGLALRGPTGTVTPQSSRAFALSGAGVTINGGLHLHGVQDVRQLDNQLSKLHRSRSQVRRGPH